MTGLDETMMEGFTNEIEMLRHENLHQAVAIQRLQELLQRARELVGRLEGLAAAAAYKEQHEPPFKPGRCFEDLKETRELLADLQEGGMNAYYERLRAENLVLSVDVQRLRGALEPFQRNVLATSLSGALAHIDREMLLNARRVFEKRNA